MSRLKNNSTEGESQPRSGAMILIYTVLDTTWRAFVPTIGGTILGVAIDNIFDIAPLATIIAITLGSLISMILLTMQIRRVRRDR